MFLTNMYQNWYVIYYVSIDIIMVQLDFAIVPGSSGMTQGPALTEEC